MSKINTISTAFAIAQSAQHKKQIDELEHKWFDIINEVQTVRGPPGLDGRKGDKGPKGDKGVKGDKGDRGDTGEQGIAGADGAPGRDGIDGKDGDRGEKGETGEQGLQGLQGLKGDKGDIGPVGKTGPQGERGLKGDTGKTGAKGDTGKTGERGKDGIQGVAGPKGDVGLQGVQGLKGDKGDSGVRGEKGEQGEQGPQGLKGDAGPDYKERFEEALEQLNAKLTENTNTVNKNVERTLSNVQKSLASIGGGGSYKIVDNADVDKAAITNLVDDAVLIYDPTKKKFVAQSFLSILDRLKADLEVQYDKLVDEDPDNGFTYVGEAVPGTTKGQSIWRIKRIYEFGADGDLDILWANGTADFDKTWNDRATYTYSAD